MALGLLDEERLECVIHLALTQPAQRDGPEAVLEAAVEEGEVADGLEAQGSRRQAQVLARAVAVVGEQALDGGASAEFVVGDA